MDELYSSATVSDETWAVLALLILWPRRFIIEVSRMRRGCCVACGYDLGYDFLRGCPECGWRRSNGTDADTPSTSAQRRQFFSGRA